jgi:hypothetical protein
MKAVLIPVVVALMGLGSGCPGRTSAPEGGPKPATKPQYKKGPPPGFRQLLPKGRIRAIRKPVYVSAKKARLAPDSWVLGVLIRGKAYAYSLTLLNSHEIVNDDAGGLGFAAVW